MALAIAHAGAYISTHQILIEQYLMKFKEYRLELLDEKIVQKQDDYTSTAYTTWRLSYNNLKDLTKEFLHLCSFMHHSGISEAMFKSAWENKGDDDLDIYLHFLQTW